MSEKNEMNEKAPGARQPAELEAEQAALEAELAALEAELAALDGELAALEAERARAIEALAADWSAKSGKGGENEALRLALRLEAGRLRRDQLAGRLERARARARVKALEHKLAMLFEQAQEAARLRARWEEAQEAAQQAERAYRRAQVSPSTFEELFRYKGLPLVDEGALTNDDLLRLRKAYDLRAAFECGETEEGERGQERA